MLQFITYFDIITKQKLIRRHTLPNFPFDSLFVLNLPVQISITLNINLKTLKLFLRVFLSVLSLPPRHERLVEDEGDGGTFQAHTGSIRPLEVLV